ncbi:MAG: sigma 54-interacting transcriptional regulator, partial [Myxococcales bacterium]|nr:sigma 54-interacting transcriptional regulator [Myxococcales bacterium]
MAGDDTATLSHLETGAPGPATTCPALALLWSRDERERVGEVTLLDPRERAGFDPQTRAFTLGRESASGRVCSFLRQRPGENLETGALRSPLLSRRQLRITPVGDELELENLGRGVLRVNGQEITRGRARVGDVVELRRRVLLLCTRRPRRLPARELDASLLDFPFGHADAYGLVGESPVLWALRERVQFLARRSLHVLLIGPSGSGKELVANAIHTLSARGDATLVSRNAATIPESLVDAELFGNASGYPNPGMRERAGLIGEAHGSSLFLDEIGELPQAMQSHLLRVMDMGEYQRLGETRRRVADVRVIAAT